MFCPWCLYDPSLSFTDRMKQFLIPHEFKKHLNNERIARLSCKTLCPVPSCGSHLYDREYRIGFHMVTVHRLPIFGSTNDTKVRSLKLPPLPPPPSTELQNKRKHLASGATPSTNDPSTSGSSSHSSQKRQKQSDGSPNTHIMRCVLS